MMQRDRELVALSVDRDHASAVRARVGGGAIEVRGVMRADRPRDVGASDADAIGTWIRDALKDAGMLGAARRHGVILAVPRGEVILKRLELPSGTSADELSDAVRLQMVRQLTISADDAAIDFVPLDETTSDTQTILSAALSGDRLAWRRQVLKAAGLKARRIGLASTGIASALAGADGGPCLTIAFARGATEFAIVDGQQLLFTRATDLDRSADPDQPDVVARRVAVEAKRTWMSYRVTHESADIAGVAVLGTDLLSRRIAELCAEMLDLPSRTMDLPDFVRFGSDTPAGERAEAAPMIGLLAEELLGRATLDFNAPRQAPDKFESTRRVVLASVLLGVLLIGGIMTAKAVMMRDLKSEIASLQRDQKRANDAYNAYAFEKARLDHVNAWLGVDTDVLSHLEQLHGLLPTDGAVLLDSLSARTESDIEFVRTERKARPYYTDFEWEASGTGVITVMGRMTDPALTDALRTRLVNDPAYAITSGGADTPAKFNWTLRTAGRPVTPDAEASDPATSEDAGADG